MGNGVPIPGSGPMLDGFAQFRDGIESATAARSFQAMSHILDFLQVTPLEQFVQHTGSRP